MAHDKRSYNDKYYADNPEELSEELFLQYQSAQDEWKQGADENEKFVAGAQWTKEQIDILRQRGQGAIVVNAITWAIEQLKAMLTANKPKFQATAREDSDVQAAQLHKMLMSYMWDISDGNSQLKLGIDDYAKMGRGAFYAYQDPYDDSGRGEVKFMSVDPRDVYPDPNSQDYLWRDASHILVVNYKTTTQIREMYPDFDFDGAQPIGDQRTNDSNRRAQDNQVFSGEKTDPNVDLYRIIDRLSKKKRRMYHVSDPFADEEYEYSRREYEEYLQKPAVTYNGQIITEDQDVQQVMMMLQQGNTEQMDQDSFLYTPEPQQNPQTGEMMQPPPVIVDIMTIADIVAEGAIAVREIKIDRIYRCITIGEKKTYSGWLDTEHYPVIPLNNMKNRTPYPISDVTHTRSLQELINKLNSLIIANATSSTNQKVLLPRGAQDKSRVERDMNKPGVSVIEFDAEVGQPVVFGAQSFPNALFAQIEMYVSMIERQFGIYSLMQGDAAAAPQTFKGTIAMDEFSQRRIKSKKDDIETTLNQLARVMMDLAKNTYTEEKVIRLVQPNGIEETQKINQIQYDDLGNPIKKINDIRQGRYDVKVISGSTMPSNRFALMEYYMDLYDRGLIDQIEVLKKSEVVDANGVLERFGVMKQMEQQINALQEEVKKLQGDLQTASREEVHAKKRLEVEKFKSELDSIKNSATAKAKIHEAQGRLQLQEMMQEQKQQQQGNQEN